MAENSNLPAVVKPQTVAQISTTTQVVQVTEVKKASKLSGIATWSLGLISGVVLIMATSSALLVGVLLLPTIMVGVADRQPDRPVARAVMLFGLAGVIMPLQDLWRAGQSMGDAMAILSHVNTLAIAWSMQAFGWLLTQIIPVVIGLAYDAQIRLLMMKMEKQRDALRDEWQDEEITS